MTWHTMVYHSATLNELILLLYCVYINSEMVKNDVSDLQHISWHTLAIPFPAPAELLPAATTDECGVGKQNQSNHHTQHCRNTDVYIYEHRRHFENHFANGLTIFIQSWHSQRQTSHNTTWAAEHGRLFLFAGGKMGRWLKGSSLRPMLNDKMWTSGTERLIWASNKAVHFHYMNKTLPMWTYHLFNCS